MTETRTPTGTIPEKYIKRGNGFYRVAWGFLRTIDKQGEPIVGHKTRDLKLALYKYPNKGKVSSFVKMQAQSGRANIGDLAFVPDVFLLYRQRSRKRYPSTLTVRVMPHQGENEHEFVFSERKTRKAKLPTELEVLPLRTSPHRTKSGETTVSTKEQESDISSKEEERKDTKTSSLPIRNEDEACKVPTRLYSRFEGGSLGNTALTFTPDGDRVVVACVETTHCPIRVFDIHTKTLCLELTGHTGIVHQLSWFPFQDKKTMLCSASSDGTVMVWNLSPSSVKKRNSIGPTFILPHPNATFVYTVAIRPMSSRRREDEDLVCVSGAYDQELRLWSLTKGTLLGNIRKAKHAHHKSHINAVVFSERGRKMFSGDNLGILIVWRLNGPSNRADSFEVLRQIKDNLPGHSINTIRLRASSTVKLDAITTVTSTPEIIVLAEGSVFQAHETMSPNAISKRFAGLKNIDLARKLSCVVSPDGRYLMAGSEDGNMYVWDANTGEQISHPAENVDCALLLNFKEAISDVAWCPNRHAVALCVMSSDVCVDFDTSHPVLVCTT